MAVKLLVEQLDGAEREVRRVVLKPRLVVRDSVSPPREPGAARRA